MNRLILVSNRLPVTVVSTPGGVSVERSVGGLATALRQPHERTGGIWVGWPGQYETSDPAAQEELERRLAELGTVPVHLSAQEVRQFYEGFANGLIWPLFHYLTGVLPLRVEGWETYRAVNARFADAVAERYRPGDIVWVHDYQLMLVPGMLRRRIPRARIGFFLHIPFPSSEVFAALPHREEVLEGLLGADLIGFHTAWYRRHFSTSIERLLGLKTVADEVAYDGRTVDLGVFPIGIDAAAFAAGAERDDVAAEVTALRGDGVCKLMVGIDRLDYTKGIPRRLLAFEELLETRPDWRGRVRLVQIAVPSRTGVRAYKRFRQEVDALVGRINGRFGTPHWMPVHYVYRGIPEVQLLALYRAADVMLVTPVRDGMNLVAKEFVATRSDDEGVLVLSEFAGAAAQLIEAVPVNPYDIERAAETYHSALTMPAGERARRMRALRRRVLAHDVFRWAEDFLRALGAGDAVPPRPDAERAATKPPLSARTRERSTAE